MAFGSDAIGGDADNATVARIAGLIEPSLADLGFDLVRVRIGSGGRPVLQVMAERTDDATMTVEDCTMLSRTISALLDVDDPIEGEYTLEVSSPGIDRPLVRRHDFERHAGFEVKIATRRPYEGRKRFRGMLQGLEGDAVVLETETGRVALPLAEIGEAKLLMTDELLRAALREGSQRNSEQTS